MESELFGHMKGAFSGALIDYEGLFVQGDGGTIFLDEIGDMPPHMQAKILRVLNDREVVPVGGKPGDRKVVDVRVIAATNKDTTDPKTLRADLLYRLNTTEINLWPLNLRPGDLILLAYYFIQDWNSHNEDGIKAIGSAVVEDIMCCHWPGNVREMKSVFEKACSTARNREENKDVVAGLDVDHDFPWPYEPKRGHRIELNRLLKLDVIKFMEKRDRYYQRDWGVPAESLGVWKLPARFRAHGGRRVGEVSDDKALPGAEAVPRVIEQNGPMIPLLKQTPMAEAEKSFKHAYIRYHLDANGGNQTQTAKAIGVERGKVTRYKGTR